MPYTPINFQDGNPTTPLSAGNLNYVQTQYSRAVADTAALIEDANPAIFEEPAAAAVEEALLSADVVLGADDRILKQTTKPLTGFAEWLGSITSKISGRSIFGIRTDGIWAARLLVGNKDAPGMIMQALPPNVAGDRFIIGTQNKAAIRVRRRGDVTLTLAEDSVIPESLLPSVEPAAPVVQDGPVNPSRLRWLRMLIRKILAGDTGTTLDILLIGDSYTHNRNRWSGIFWSTLVALLGNAGVGWVGFSYYPGNQGLRNGSASSGVTIGQTGTWTENYYGTRSVDLGELASSSAGSTITVTFPTGQTRAWLHYIATAGATITYAWGGGSATALDLSTGTAGQLAVAALSNPAGTDTTLTITVTGGTVTLCGVDLRNTSTGVRVHKVAATGSSAQQWATASASASWRAAVAAINPDVVMVMHGANDQNGNRTPAQFSTDIGTILASLNTALGQGSFDRFVIMQPENQQGKTQLMKNYTTATAPIADAADAAFLDTQPYFGSADAPNEYGSASNRPLFNVDNLHPEPNTGGRVLADPIIRTALYS